MLFTNKVRLSHVFRKIFLGAIFSGIPIFSFAQIRIYPANSIQETYLILSHLHGIDGNRYYPQNAEEMQKAWAIPAVDTQLESVGLLPNFNRTKLARDYFQYAHPELSGAPANTPRFFRFAKKWGPENMFYASSEFFSWHDSVNPQNTYFVINPIVYTEFGPSVGKNIHSFSNASKGLEFFGKFSKNVSFSTQALDNTYLLKQYQTNYRLKNYVIPGSTYSGGRWDTADDFKARGSIYINLYGSENSSRKIQMSFGHDNNFIGYGYRSLIISNFSPASAYLKFNYKLGPFRYQNLFQQLTAFQIIKGESKLSWKYLAIHRATLELNHPKTKKEWLEIGVSESVYQGRNNNIIDLNYLNPIIFYRSVERDLGSPDNVIINADFRLKNRNYLIYGQFALDEFEFANLKRGNSPRNKFGYQIGGYYLINPKSNIGSFVLQFEFNSVRPYTYSHYSVLSNTVNFNQSNIHPLEANFKEGVFQIKYKPAFIRGLLFTSTTILAKKGFDFQNDTVNYGGDIRKNYRNPASTITATMLQGDLGTIFNSKSQLYFELMPNMWMYLGYQYRNQTGHNASSERYVFLGLRWNWYEEQQLF